MSQSLGCASGQCTVCGSTFRLVASTGVLRKHGFGSSHPARVGSGILTLACGHAPTNSSLSSTFNISNSSSSSQLPSGHDCDSTPFNFVGFNGVILKRLPKSARAFVAVVFQRCLSQLLSDGLSPSRWLRLFQFPSCFAQPPRGGKRRNLMSRSMAQLRLFDEGGLVCEVQVKGGHAARVKRHEHVVLDEDVDSARWSSIKLADGDVRGGVRLLCSAEQGVMPDQHSLGQNNDI